MPIAHGLGWGWESGWGWGWGWAPGPPGDGVFGWTLAGRASRKILMGWPGCLLSRISVGSCQFFTDFNALFYGQQRVLNVVFHRLSLDMPFFITSCVRFLSLENVAAYLILTYLFLLCAAHWLHPLLHWLHWDSPALIPTIPHFWLSGIVRVKLGVNLVWFVANESVFSPAILPNRSGKYLLIF